MSEEQQLTPEQAAAIEKQVVISLVQIAQAAHKAAKMTDDPRLNRVAVAAFNEIDGQDGVMALMDMVVSLQAEQAALQQGIQKDPLLEEREQQQQKMRQRVQTMMDEKFEQRMGNPQLVTQIQNLIDALEAQNNGPGTN